MGFWCGLGYAPNIEVKEGLKNGRGRRFFGVEATGGRAGERQEGRRGRRRGQGALSSSSTCILLRRVLKLVEQLFERLGGDHLAGIVAVVGFERALFPAFF